jgi:hypothetical protein
MTFPVTFPFTFGTPTPTPAVLPAPPTTSGATPPVNNLRIMTAEYMISNTAGLGVKTNWLPRVVTQAFLQSTKDGDIQISPDPVDMITGDMTWFNDTGDPQVIWVLVHRAPRAITAQNPCTVIITDGWTSQIGVNPQANSPGVSDDWFGGKLQIDRPATLAADLHYARYFLEGDDLVSYVPVGVVPPTQMFQFRYRAAVQTPGVWTEPTVFQGEYMAYAYWTRLVALASPVGSGGGFGTIPAAYIPPGSTAFTKTKTYYPPTWANFLDLVGVGGGGSGEGEILINMGQGGGAGSWNATTLVAGTDFTPGVTEFTITPGAGGYAVIDYFGEGHPGAATTITWTDPFSVQRTFTCAGGVGGHPGLFGYAGNSPGNFVFNGVPYLGGGKCLPGTSGKFPGGGGGGAIIFEPFSGFGAPGEAWIVARVS